MQQDYKQERKWKINMAKVVGGWILQYFKTGSRNIVENVCKFLIKKLGVSLESVGLLSRDIKGGRA